MEKPNDTLKKSAAIDLPSYESAESMLKTTITNYPILNGEDLNLTLEETLIALRRGLTRIKSQFRQAYITCERKNLDILKEALAITFDSLSLDLILPDNYDLSRGVFDLVKELIDTNNDKVETKKYTIVFVKNFMDIAVSNKSYFYENINHSQPYTHLYNQNTGEDMGAAMKGIPSRKTFEGYPTRILIVTLIDDSFGLQKQKEIYRIAAMSDFADIINIP